jgi:hypothetical protein
MSVDYITFQDGEVTLPKPNGDVEQVISFATASPDPAASGVLSFLVNPNGGTPTLALILNNTVVTTMTFGTDVRRVMQENVQQGVLNGNDTLRVRLTGGGSVSVSDFHLLYKSL